MTWCRIRPAIWLTLSVTCVLHMTSAEQDTHIQDEGTVRGRSEDSRGLFKDLVNGALYLAGTRVLGENVTNSLVPLARPLVDRFVPEQPIRLSDEGRIVIDFSPDPAEDKTDRPDLDPVAEGRHCTTPGSGRGVCRDLSDCPQLLLDLANLRASICFQEIFVPGVCCPSSSSSFSSSAATTRPPTRRPRPPVHRPQPQTTRPHPTRPHPTRPHPTHALPTLPHFTHRPVPITQQPDRFPCGEVQTPELRVVGGDPSRPGQWPWMAAIYLHGNGRKEFWCGGTLISSQHILTAAHCTKDSNGKSFHPRQFTVRLGDYDLTTNTELSDPATYRVLEYTAHPQFRKNGFYNDIAVFKLSSPVEQNQFVIPVCLPEEYEGTELDSLVGQTPSVIGWGTTYYGGEESAILRQAELPVWKQQDCDEVYFQPIREMFLCAGYASGGKDACQGDSGGPLLHYESGHWMQVGIVSFGNRCAQPGYPGVYTRITQFLPWMRQVMRS